MKAIILSAGQGSRLGHLVDDRPKCLIDFNGRSLLDRQLDTLEGGRPMVSVTVGARAAESEVADLLRETEASNPGVAIGSYPFFKDGRYGANFVVRSEDGDLARSTGNELSKRLREAGYEPVDGGI